MGAEVLYNRLHDRDRVVVTPPRRTAAMSQIQLVVRISYRVFYDFVTFRALVCSKLRHVLN